MTIIRNTLSMAVKYGMKHPINIGRNHKHGHKPRIIIITEFPAFLPFRKLYPLMMIEAEPRDV